ncbi:hypothetical protein FOL47_000713, partial [Perkinsus chesapeaki]
TGPASESSDIPKNQDSVASRVPGTSQNLGACINSPGECAAGSVGSSLGPSDSSGEETMSEEDNSGNLSSDMVDLSGPPESEDGGSELLAAPEGGSRNERFSDEPFLVRRGHLYDVVQAYLAEHEHYRLVDLTLAKLRDSRRSCVLECRRGPSKRKKKPVKSSRPDWRLWPEFTCPLTQCLVRMVRETCYFFPLKEATASAQQWRAHSHPHKSYVCHSGTLPPDICDHWAALVNEDPSITLDDLIEASNEWYASARYSPTTIAFILNKGLRVDPQNESPGIRDLIDSFKNYLSDTEWRSYWGSYVIGPRTNNGVERFNGELKKVLLKSRYRRTLAELGGFFKSPRKWVRLSQYGGKPLVDEVTKQQRKLASKLFYSEKYCLIPTSWYAANSWAANKDLWLYVHDEAGVTLRDGLLADSVHGDEDFEAKKLVTFKYESMAEVRRLRKTYCIVSYENTANLQAPPPRGPICSCLQWCKKHLCPHVISTAHLMNEENSSEWVYLRTFFSLPRRRRGKKGRITDQALPGDIRYGMGNSGPKRRRQSRRKTQQAPDT